MKKALFSLLVIVSLISGCTITIPNPFEQQNPTSIPVLPAYQVYSEFQTGAVAAAQKYKNKTIALSGTVASVGVDMIGNPYVVLNSPDNAGTPIPCAQGMFTKQNAPMLSGVNNGDTVYIYGKFYGFQVYVILTNCIIAK